MIFFDYFYNYLKIKFVEIINFFSLNFKSIFFSSIKIIKIIQFISLIIKKVLTKVIDRLYYLKKKKRIMIKYKNFNWAISKINNKHFLIKIKYNSNKIW